MSAAAPVFAREAPLVSVLLPVHDGEAFLGAALRSVLAQSLRDFELVVVDDHSGDASAALAAGTGDARVRVIPAEGRGLSAALNQGLACCRGRFVARMDADDLCRPGRLEAQVAFLESHPETDVLGGQIRLFGVFAPRRRFFGVLNPRQPRKPLTHEAIQAAAIFECPVVHPTVMFRASLLSRGAAVYDPGQPHAEDYGLWTRWLLGGVRFAVLPDRVLDYRLHPGQVSSSKLEEQVRTADSIRLLWLHRLGLDPSPAEMELHRSVGRGTWGGRGLDYMEALEGWLLKLRAAAADSAFSGAEALDATLAQRWSGALWSNRRLGAPLRRLARISPLGGLLRPRPWKPWACWAGSFLPSRKRA